LRRLLADRRFVFLAADGPFGGELFRLDLPGYSPVIKTGWFVLRRQLRLRTLPVLAHDEGSQRIVTIYPPLPAPTGDEAADKAICREVLTTVLGDYVRRYPSQCRYLAFPPWPS
jgi:lauroyl/myristoyl acyltransferase